MTADECQFCKCGPGLHRAGCQCGCHADCECQNCLERRKMILSNPLLGQALQSYGIRVEDKRPIEYLEDRTLSHEDRVLNYCRTHSIEGFKTLEVFMQSLLEIVDGNYDPSSIQHVRTLLVLSKTALEHMIAQKLLDKSKTLGKIPMDDWVQRIMRNQ